MKAKKIRFILYGALLFLPIVVFADIDYKNYSSPNTNYSGYPDSTNINENGNKATAVKTAIAGRPEENKHYIYLYNDEIISVERFINPEKIAQQMMEQAIELCKISRELWQSGELDRAIESLDQAYLLILSINTYESESLIRQKEDMRLMISKRIIEIYASREIIINGSQNEIPVILNKQVQYEIDLYTKGDLRNHFIASYKRSGKYRQMIVSMLKEEGLPQELSWLPLVESGFRIKALSKSRALGLWQFMPSTGYKFGLNRNRYIDERMNPAKSTQAAIDYLKELHNHFGDWSTALAAYNWGETRVLRVIQKQKINYLDNFWDLYEQLPQETSRYVPKFLATLHIVNNIEKYGLDKVIINSPLKYESLKVTKNIHLNNVAKITGIDKKSLEELNPELRQSILPGGSYSLKIPKGYKQKLLANIDQILRLNPAKVDCIKHRVRSGESLSLIARRYRTSVANIMLANDLHRTNYIATGETLKIPYKIKNSNQRKIVTLSSGNSWRHLHTARRYHNKFMESSALRMLK